MFRSKWVHPRQSWILDSTFVCILCISVSRSWIPDYNRSGIPDSLSWIPDSKAQDCGFHEQNFPGFRNPYYLTRDEILHWRYWRKLFSFLSSSWKCPVEKAGNGETETETVKLKVFWVSITTEPPCLERVRSSHFSSSANTFKLARYGPEISERRAVLPWGGISCWNSDHTVR